MNTISQTDELLLVDDIQGRLDRKESEALKDRMAIHPELRKLRKELAATLAALEVATATRAPHGLSGRTLDHIATVQRTNALLAIQESRSRRRSSFSFRERAGIAAVLVVMLGLIIPSLRIARQHRDEGLCAAQLGQIGVGLNTYAMNHEGNLPAPPDGKPSRWMPGAGCDSGSLPEIRAAAVTGRVSLAATTTRATCPASKRNLEKTESCTGRSRQTTRSPWSGGYDLDHRCRGNTSGCCRLSFLPFAFRKSRINFFNVKPIAHPMHRIKHSRKIIKGRPQN